ncbi:putative cation-transporting atpase plant [Corchorus capsularis]|uniref:Putative cation-transporting atpase plant n=1 Tax=Corchorus capsularis TaxID=210143 RepID=A0A1R3I6X1_COCAP|nr:putative cation-transporting atpase plant [Corchorus capsularis]
MSSSDEFKLYDCSSLLLNVTTSSLSKAQRRWRIAYTAIYSARVMLSLVKDIISEKGSQNPSVIKNLHHYVALDIESSGSKQLAKTKPGGEGKKDGLFLYQQFTVLKA